MNQIRTLVLATAALLPSLGCSQDTGAQEKSKAPQDHAAKTSAFTPISGISGNLNSIGSDTLNNLMTFWSESFSKLYPSVKFQVDGKGSNTAPPALIAGTSQLAPMSREMKSTEIDEFEKKYGYKPTQVKVAIDALAVYVHKDNPLAKLTNGKYIVLDGHVDMEAEARGSHKALLAELGIGDDETRLARPPTAFELEGVRVNAVDHRGVAGNVVEFDGNLGLIIGAGGGSLTLFDAVRKHGGKPANYCEIGGNPSVGKAKNLTRLILSKPGVEKIAVMMNVVSNTRVDIVARGVIKGCLEAGKKPSDVIAIFRIPGSWEEEGFKILKKYGVDYCDRSVSMYEAAGRAVAKLKKA